LGELHVSLLKSIIKDIEDVARTPPVALGVNLGGGHPLSERSHAIPYYVSVSANFGSKCRFRTLRTRVNLAGCADFLPTRCTLIFIEQDIFLSSQIVIFCKH
jgi:hypothetical protein